MELLEKRELIAPEYIEEAQLPLPQKKIHWGYFVALAASIVLAVVAGGFFLAGRRTSVPGVHDYYGDGVASVISRNGNLSLVLLILGLILIAFFLFLIVRAGRTCSIQTLYHGHRSAERG